ncbi:MAG: hypothetical protein HYT76_07000 [Deltaproteobacteria bacterium]|nr:hypothetical protein [Deltaproteobacteria bacterium]
MTKQFLWREVRSSLCNIKLATEIVMTDKRSGPLSPDQKRALELLQKNNDRLARVVEILIQLQKMGPEPMHRSIRVWHEGNLLLGRPTSPGQQRGYHRH